MDMRGALMPRPPRDRGGLMRPGPPFAFRGRGVMLMDRPRLPPRPLMRGVPPFVGRGMLPPGRHRPPLGPVMLPRPLPPPHGALGHLGPRGLLPRPMLHPTRPLHPELMEVHCLANGIARGDENNKNIQAENHSGPTSNHSITTNPSNLVVKTNCPESRVNQNVGQQNTATRKNRKDSKNQRGSAGQLQTQQTPQSHHNQVATQAPAPLSHSSPVKQNTHPNHQIQHQPPPQNIIRMNQAPLQKHVPPMQSPMNANIQPLAPQHPMTQSVCGGQNGINHMNRGNAHMGPVGIPNTPSSVAMSQGHVMHHGGPSIGMRGNFAASVPPRPNVMMNGLPPPQYSGAPPPSNYAAAAAAPVMTQQMPMKRSAPPVGPPAMQPKRVRYEPPPPPPANGYVQYQQPPPQQQPVYQSYDVPPPTDMYSSMPSANVNVAPQQAYPSPDYTNYQAPPPQQNTSYCQSVDPQYSTAYSNQGNYSTYTTAGGYDQSVDYNAVQQQQQQSNVDPYGYSKPVDSYGYTNTSYTTPQPTGYEDYSGGYVDQSGYTSTIQDPSYGQSVGTYQGYSY